MWSETGREQYRREDLRYASDMTDAEWALIPRHLPGEKALGRPRIVPLRGVVDALLYLLRTPVHGVCCRAIFRSGRIDP
jgi:transposase